MQNDDTPIYTPRPQPSKDDNSGDSNTKSKNTDSPTNSSGGTPTNSSESNSVTPPMPKISGDVEKIEQNASLFLRRIAQSDPRAFLTGKQAETVNSKIGQFKDSSALAENLKAVKKNAAQFETLANFKKFESAVFGDCRARQNRQYARRSVSCRADDAADFDRFENHARQ